MTKDEALRLALDALRSTSTLNAEQHLKKRAAVIAIKEALAAPVQEPAGYWQGEFSKGGGATLYEVPQESVFGRKYPNIPLYTTPPAAQRQWVGLTSQDWNVIGFTSEFRAGAEWANDKLKEKNHGH